MRQVNAKLKELIKKSGMNQKEIAEILEITPEYLSSIVRGRHSPSFQLAQKFADLFGTTVDSLFLSNDSTFCA